MSTTSSIYEDVSPNKGNLRRQLTIRSRERCLNKLRSEDPDKLLQFCKLHISFLTDMDCSSSFDELFSDKQSKQSKISNFLGRKKSTGSIIDDQCESPGHESPTSTHIDAIVQLVELLQNCKHLSCEGIFRKTGNKGRQNELKRKLLLSEPMDMQVESCNILDYTSVLKSLLGELPEPLLHERFIKAHLFSLKIAKIETRIKIVSLLLQMMSLSHYMVAKAVFKLLQQVAALSQQNLMTVDNLGVIFAPHMLCSKKATPQELQAIASSAQSVTSFIISNAPQLFQPPELLAMDIANHIRKTKVSLNTSEDSILSFESVHSGDSQSRKHKLSRDEDSNDDPLDTVVAFADRAKVQDNTQLELAKLYSYVQGLPDSEKQKHMFMKRIKEDKSSQSPVGDKRRSRTRSLGRSIRRRLSKSRKRSSSTNRDTPKISSPVFENDLTDNKQTNIKKLRDEFIIDPLPNSPYTLHRLSMKMLREKELKEDEVIANTAAIEAHNQLNDTVDGQITLDLTSGSITGQVPSIRKPLLPSNVPSSAEKRRFLKRTKDYQATPPRPTKKMAIVDSNLMF